MSKIVIILVFIFWVVLSIFFARSIFSKENPPINNQINQINNNTNTGALSALGSQLAEHNTSSDCWLVIDGGVYDVTDYIYSHPGGAGEMIQYCGQDATQAFATKDKSAPQEHSATAKTILASYYIGAFQDTAVSNTNTNNNTNINANLSNPTPVNYTLTQALVAQHNTSSDCWVTAGNTVYNVTNYIFQHPGGSSRIIPYCGSDLQAAFDAQGHSANARQILAGLEIGTLGQAVSAQNTNPAAPVNNNNNNKDDDDDEEEDDD